MSLSSSLQSLKLSSSATLLHGTTPVSEVWKHTSASVPSTRAWPGGLVVKAMKSIQGRVVCAVNDKTVAVEVVRLAPHPKYKRRVRKKKKYQAHDPDNQFQVGDFVQLEKTRPISKTKAFLAIPVPPKNKPSLAADGELGIPLESQQQTD